MRQLSSAGQEQRMGGQVGVKNRHEVARGTRAQHPASQGTRQTHLATPGPPGRVCAARLGRQHGLNGLVDGGELGVPGRCVCECGCGCGCVHVCAHACLHACAGVACRNEGRSGGKASPTLASLSGKPCMGETGVKSQVMGNGYTGGCASPCPSGHRTPSAQHAIEA